MSNAGLALGRCGRRTRVQLLSVRLLGNRTLLGECLSISMLGALGDEPRLSLDGETLDEEELIL